MGMDRMSLQRRYSKKSTNASVAEATASRVPYFETKVNSYRIL